ncbi:hypothetical protein VTK56DRAFT_677 [Thermocarpiscus australiensis]
MSPFARVNGGVGWLESRDDTRWMQGSNCNRSRNGLFQSVTNRTNTQQMFLNELKFAAAKSIRTSAIILATFNIVAAFATALGILCDCYFRERRNNKKFKFRRNAFFNPVPEGEVYPLVLSFGIFIQNITFAGSQATGLDSLFGLGCTTIAQLMLPSIFIAPYIQLVFAVEIAIRALQKKPFAPRRRYNLSVCLVAIGMLILANFLVAAFDRSPDFCLTSLFWFVSHYSVLCFVLLTAIAFIVLVCTVIIFVRLHRSIKAEVTARVSASRMVYYLALAVISDGFMLPFFFALAFIKDERGQNPNALTLSMVASVVANVSGLMTGGLYLFLKTSGLSTIGPRGKVGEYGNRRAKYKIIRYETNDPDNNSGFDSHFMHPVARPRSLCRMDGDASLMSTEKEEEALDGRSVRSASIKYSKPSLNSPSSNTPVSVTPTALIPKAPEPAHITPRGGHMRKRSYSLFPSSTPAAKSPITPLPATTYSPADALKPPPSMGNLINRHQRDSSLMSSATVQIGLRLSSVDDMPAVVKDKVTINGNVVHSLDCPKVVGNQVHKHAEVSESGVTACAPRPEVMDESPERNPVKDARMKTLPPAPKLDS